MLSIFRSHITHRDHVFRVSVQTSKTLKPLSKTARLVSSATLSRMQIPGRVGSERAWPRMRCAGIT